MLSLLMKDYRLTHPEVTVLDPPDAIQHVYNRQSMLQDVADLDFSDSYGTVGVPKQLVIEKDPSSISDAVKVAGLSLPLVAKPLVAKSHELSLAYDEYSLQKLEPPLVLQEFVNHGYNIKDLIQEAQFRWLRPGEVLFILQNYEESQLNQQPPQKPPSGSLFLFNKRVLRFFRKDGHSWRRKKDGKNVGEAHERQKAMVKLIIQRYTREAGVRNLERNLAALARAATVRVTEQEHTVPLNKDVHQISSPLLESRLAEGGANYVEMEVIPMGVNKFL